MMVDEAIAVAEKFLDSSSIHMVNRGLKFDQNSVVFHMLCVRQLILEKLRAELITRKSLSSYFAFIMQRVCDGVLQHVDLHTVVVSALICIAL